MANLPVENALFHSGVHWASLADRPSATSAVASAQAVFTAGLLSYTGLPDSSA